MLGRYELITLIGKGGMAEVHLAVQRGPAGFEKLVVVKLVHAHLATQKAFVDMLLDEGRLAGMIKHPNVVDIYDLGEADGRYFVAMEYLDGEPLLAVLRAGADGKRLDPLSTARVIADTAEGLEAAHRLKSRDGKPLGLVHHDVSLGNIVVLYTGVVKLVDFGVAKARSADKRDQVQGKFSYMAPEKLQEGAEIDRRSDLWSLGCVAWEALTLSRLFKGDDDAETVRQVLEAPILPPSQVNPEVPEDFDPIVMRALERDPAKRYSTAKAMALDLEEVLRKHGYAGKNDRIVKYMEETFAEHIAVRERLLRDVSEGKPSPEVIEAFRESSTVTSTGEGPISVQASELADGVSIRRGDPSWSVSNKAKSLKGLQQWVDDSRRKRRWRLLPLAIGGALLVLLIIVIASGGGDDDSAAASITAPAATVELPRGPLPAPTPSPDGSAAPAPSPDAATIGSGDGSAGAASETGSGSAVTAELDEIEMDPVLATRTPASRRVIQTKPASAETLYANGLEAFRRGDTKVAIAALGEARRVNPNYAPAWYGLGLVHESVGNRGAAKAAYLRYLSLAPRAANAEQIRARLERL